MAIARHPRKISLSEKLSLFSEHWRPKIIGELNGQEVKLSKFRGEFIWHKHDDADELFLVVRGAFRLDFRDGSVELKEGEMIIVPKGVEHRPVAADEVAVMLFEPAGVSNTGNVQDSPLTTQNERL
jgi:mannose-6-phosphate isomerase-like protein (cupin superfamily)